MAAKFPNVRIFQAALEQSGVELDDLAGVEVPWSRPTAGMNAYLLKCKHRLENIPASCYLLV